MMALLHLVIVQVTLMKLCVYHVKLSVKLTTMVVIANERNIAEVCGFHLQCFAKLVTMKTTPHENKYP